MQASTQIEFFKSFTQLAQASLPPLVVTIGNFDGIHKGHQKILETLKQQAQKYLGAKTLLVVFDPQPQEFFGLPIARLTTIEQKLDIFSKYNLVDYLLVLDFNQDLANIEGEDFIAKLCTSTNIKEFLIGDDFRFGKDRKGNLSTFKKLSDTYGYKINSLKTINLQKITNNLNVLASKQELTTNLNESQQIDLQAKPQNSALESEIYFDSNTRISSTLIRRLLANGQIEQANQLLCEPFHFEGKVVTGKQLARTLQMPTANIKVTRKISPLKGVYYCKVQINDQVENKQPTNLYGVCNIGNKPTVNKSPDVWDIETHILNFNQEIYGKNLKIYPVAKVRDEKKFSSIDELKTAIHNDVESAYKFFALPRK